ncbi:hypothetical protein [Bradyrhizobium sp. CCGUVB23]|uniref:hypothetical protein n=1 Tax=Bradyrhizobium sp. CCGUVB23 TaxID=2949630 RepID=UPI0020B28321|nr:hypothetical protein [Bradyrhizobium sp. CCGUVB23]MCP3462540.1 hypothetical protein [Bradyrhizobium sp. CCGUVB23]
MSSRDMVAAHAALRAKHKAAKARPKPRKPHLRRNGIPPHPDFDIDKLPPSALLTPLEVAAVKRCSLSTIAKHRADPAHKLKWVDVDGHPRCRARDLLDDLARSTKVMLSELDGRRG